MTTLADRALDEARAIAMGNHHEHVEPRHVLWGLMKALGNDAPPNIPAARVKLLMSPEGTFKDRPDVSPEAQAILDKIDGIPAGQAVAVELAKQLLANVPEFADPAVVAGTGATTATATTQSTTDSSKPAPATDTTESVLAELDALVGLAAVKASVRRLIAVQSLNAERKAGGLPEVNASHHIVFTGHPGTGKTTVARLIARLYRTIGVLSKGQLVEATRADLVAGYVGQTALKVQEVVKGAIGGILFID